MKRSKAFVSYTAKWNPLLQAVLNLVILDKTVGINFEAPNDLIQYIALEFEEDLKMSLNPVFSEGNLVENLLSYNTWRSLPFEEFPRNEDKELQGVDIK